MKKIEEFAKEIPREINKEKDINYKQIQNIMTNKPKQDNENKGDKKDKEKISDTKKDDKDLIKDIMTNKFNQDQEEKQE